MTAGEFHPITRATPVEPEPPYVAYEVRKGDTLVGIAEHFGISMMTIWWASDLTSKDLRIGQRLLVPVIDGLLLVTGADDSVGSLAAKIRGRRVADPRGERFGRSIDASRRTADSGARSARCATQGVRVG